MSGTESAKMRAFVAIELDESAKAHIAAAIEQLRRERIERLRLVRPEGVHLTLKFLGDIEAAQASRVAEAMTRAAVRHAPFSLSLGSPGVFPNPRRARVLWVGVEGALKELRMLQSSVEEELVAAGFPAERQRFNPHLTIGRMHHRASPANRKRAAGVLSALCLPADQAVTVNAISLMKSTLLPGGAIYERLACVVLASPAPRNRAGK